MRYRTVERVVMDYLDRSRQAGKLLNPVTELKMPILEQGFSPPGIQDAIVKISQLQPRRRRRAADFHYGMPEKARQVEEERPQEPPAFPDADELIEIILTPGPKPPSLRERRLHRLYNPPRD
jgi:hypothetical protein